MDLQKEREAFEAVTSVYHCIYNADLNYYFSGSKFVGNKAEIEVNAGWKAWQAAKAESHKSASLYQLEINHLASANQQLRECAARAVTLPDGYVVVPKEPSANLVDHGHQVFLGHFNEGGQSGGRSLYFAYKAMIEAAQEQDND